MKCPMRLVMMGLPNFNELSSLLTPYLNTGNFHGSEQGTSMRFVAYRTEPQVISRSSTIGVVISERVAPLAAIEDFYADVEGWKEKASVLTTGKIPVAELA